MGDLPVCGRFGKMCYTRSEARQQARRLMHQRQNQGSTEMEAYECSCPEAHPDGAGRWHVGHRSRRR